MKQILVIGLKILIVIVALILGVLGANQVGWSGADLVINVSVMPPTERLVTGFLALVGIVMVTGTIVLVKKIAKPILWLMVPILLYSALVPGMWNGIAGDFDATRVEVIKHHFANAYALEHMSLKARLLSCKDERIELTDDAKAVCELALK